MELSKRLETVANMVRFPRMADIGTDHGYVPIYLHKLGRIEKALACDVNKGPLERAKKNIRVCCATGVVEPRLGSGLEPIEEGEVDSIVIAGMGGMLMVSLLEKGKEVTASAKELILSPHLDLDTVRRYLHETGFTIDAEEMVVEDGKFYTVLRAVSGQEQYEKEIEYLFGKILLDRKDPILLQYVENQLHKMKNIQQHLLESPTPESQKRLFQLREEEGIYREVARWLSI